MDEKWTEGGAPLISPDAKFRQELHRALQDSYQRQQVQRQLYGDASHAASRRRSPQSLLMFFAALSMLTLIFGLGYYFGRRVR
ncbi:MAG: hypothetical protein R6W76_13860 [Caldilinea sp.]|jgi:hypothetical protein